jgi:hypothetical protein
MSVVTLPAPAEWSERSAFHAPGKKFVHSARGIRSFISTTRYHKTDHQKQKVPDYVHLTIAEEHAVVAAGSSFQRDVCR